MLSRRRETPIEKMHATDWPMGEAVEALFIITVNDVCGTTEPIVSDNIPRQADSGCIKEGI